MILVGIFIILDTLRNYVLAAGILMELRLCYHLE